MACNDCSGSGTCRGEAGGFDTEFTGDVIGGDKECEPDNDWFIKTAINPQNGSTETYDEVEGSKKHIWVNGHFANTPEAQITNNCEGELGTFTSIPQNAEFRVRHPSGEDTAEYDLADPRPNDNGNYQNFVMNTLLDVVAGATGSVYVTVGTAVLQNYISSQTSDTGKVQPYDPDPDRQEILWDIEYGPDAEFPTDACNCVGVRFDIEPAVNSGTHPVNAWTRQSFSQAQYMSGYECVCEPGIITGYVATTDWCQKTAEFEFNS